MSRQRKPQALDSSTAWLEGFGGPVTVCDGAGIILYMNEAASRWYRRYGGRERVGKNLLNCHPEPSRSQVAAMLGHHSLHAYSIERDGKRYVVYQTSWSQNGAPAGLVELILEMPEDHTGAMRRNLT